MIQNLINDLYDYVRKSLNGSNCIIIYDQIIKLQRDFPPLVNVRKLIQLYGEAAFMSDYFTEISEKTLVDLLKMEVLRIKEIDILRSVSKWLDGQLQRSDLSATTANKQKLFEPIKSLINFGVLSLEDVNKNEDLLKSILTMEETISLLFHLMDKSKPFIIDYQSPRHICSIVEFSGLVNLNISTSGFQTYLSPNRKLLIISIHTLLSSSVSDLKLKILKNNQELLVELENILIDDKWCFEFNRKLEVDPRNNYLFQFSFNNFQFDSNNLLSRKFKPNKLNNQIILSLDSEISTHCIKKICFHF